MLEPNQLNLVRRYLIWCYKTTKEDLDRIDRYFTQAIVDDFLLEELNKRIDKDDQLSKRILEFEDYKNNKLAKAESKKFDDMARKVLNPDYRYLLARLEAIEAAIKNFLGDEGLVEIADLYESEMTQRILSARDHT